LTTYTRIAFTGKRSKVAPRRPAYSGRNVCLGQESEHLMKLITGQEWGLLLMDEVHVVPAQMFRKASSSLTGSPTHGTLGDRDHQGALQAGSDNDSCQGRLITDLNFLIGPKLYEANWLET